MSAVAMPKGCDINGRVYAKLGEIKAGDTIEVDDGFGCMLPGRHEVYEVDGNLYVKCFAELEEAAEKRGETFDKHDPTNIADHGHALSGQLEGHDHGKGIYIGIYTT